MVAVCRQTGQHKKRKPGLHRETDHAAQDDKLTKHGSSLDRNGDWRRQGFGHDIGKHHEVASPSMPPTPLPERSVFDENSIEVVQGC